MKLVVLFLKEKLIVLILDLCSSLSSVMSSSNNGYNNGSNNGVFPLSLYLSSLSGHQDIICNPYNHQLTASPGQMVSAVPESLMDYMAFNSNNVMNQQGFEIPEVSREKKKAVKKDRHSKIHTAQGLRERRVRLSIGISRQFFDLHGPAFRQEFFTQRRKAAKGTGSISGRRPCHQTARALPRGMRGASPHGAPSLRLCVFA